MSWADQGFSWELTNPREIMWHLYRAFEERASGNGPNKKDVLDLSKIERGTPISLEAFQEIDNWIIHSAGTSNFFSEPDQPLPKPAFENYGDDFLYPMTIEKLEMYLGEPLIIPNRAIKKFPREWAIQRYRIANLLYEWLGEGNTGGGYITVKSEGEYRYLLSDHTSGMVHDFEEMVPSHEDYYGIPSQFNRSSLRRNYYGTPHWILEQRKAKTFIVIDRQKGLQSHHCNVYGFGTNIDPNSSLDSSDITLEYYDGDYNRNIRYIYDDYGTGILQGVYTNIAEYDYKAGEDMTVYIIQDFPYMNTLPLFNESDVTGEMSEIGIYRGFYIASFDMIARLDFRPSYQYYDPPE